VWANGWKTRSCFNARDAAARRRQKMFFFLTLNSACGSSTCGMVCERMVKTSRIVTQQTRLFNAVVSWTRQNKQPTDDDDVRWWEWGASLGSNWQFSLIK
jgi:hypothetical protein